MVKNSLECYLDPIPFHMFLFSEMFFFHLGCIIKINNVYPLTNLFPELQTYVIYFST